MRENHVSVKCDRSYFCLVAIYAIHALLLNVVFPQTTLTAVRSSGISMSPRHLLVDNRVTSVNKNMSKSTREFGNSVVVTSRTNTTVQNERKIIDVVRDEDEDYRRKLPTRAFSQSKSGGAAIHFVSILKTSNVLRVTNNAIDTARSIVERLTPAALGIISGCLVFLVTFTDNYCV